MSGHMRPVEPDEPRMLGDHPALDILNTVERVKGELVDSLQSDRDVLRWLTRAGWPVEDGLAHLGKPSLLENARALRETNQSCAYIAHEAGFCDQSHLSRVFARSLGSSPRDWRRRNRARVQ